MRVFSFETSSPFDFAKKIIVILLGLSVGLFCLGIRTSNASPVKETSTVLSVQPRIAYSHPTQITIPKIKVANSIKEMGVTGDNKMAVPNNFTEVGWYAKGTVPGDIGNAVIGAHVDNGGSHPTVRGVFKDLTMLVTGDDIYITNKDGSTLHFKVIAKKIYPYNAASTSEIFGESGNRNLNLITCYGSWLPVAGTYSQRLIIFATLI